MTDYDLIEWFRTRALPTGPFQIAPWMSTGNLAGMVELAIERMERGNRTSRRALELVKERLEAEPANG